MTLFKNFTKVMLLVALLVAACEEKKKPRPEEVIRVPDAGIEAGVEDIVDEPDVSGQEDPCAEIECEDCELEDCPDHSDAGEEVEVPVEEPEDPDCLEEPCETEEIIEEDPDAGVPDEESVPG